ncbi:bacillithiol system redox-active protein YtxJ [Halobacillus halophilus]|uniref:bacillithiol system redox-active protein YtxJ n=1 Tax=Halobacillus halophilus TaxID=1570 RepID=UPI001CD6B3E3|nr:bacillithiol system redox-active protein YtxJ [Halobacillus halophilus]MCA1009962.1 bacillithiol system redox-active protein YtxJ [Halobacillus halophilus]
MSVQMLKSKEEFTKVLNEESIFFLLKHSLTCPISAAAESEYEQFSQHSEIPCYELFVQDARDLSNQVASDFDVRHQSPQAILFKDKQVAWHDSHGNVTKERLTKAAVDE